MTPRIQVRLILSYRLFQTLPKIKTTLLMAIQFTKVNKTAFEQMNSK